MQYSFPVSIGRRATRLRALLIWRRDGLGGHLDDVSGTAVDETVDGLTALTDRYNLVAVDNRGISWSSSSTSSVLARRRPASIAAGVLAVMVLAWCGTSGELYDEEMEEGQGETQLLREIGLVFVSPWCRATFNRRYRPSVVYAVHLTNSPQSSTFVHPYRLSIR